MLNKAWKRKSKFISKRKYYYSIHILILRLFNKWLVQEKLRWKYKEMAVFTLVFIA